jgi:methylglutaconyl-CoA hydratase
MSLVLSEIKDRVGYITLNRPEKRNALSPELVEQLKQAFDGFREASAVKVIVLQAEGKAFCAGADLSYLQKLQGFSPEENIEDSRSLSELFKMIYEFPKVVIAKVQGHAIAGGCGLASVCDFILTVPEAKFGYTEVRIGFVPAIVSYFLIKKIGESRAREYLLSGDLYDAIDFAKSGLIYKIAEDHEVLGASVSSLADRLISKNSAASMKLTKSLLSNIGQLKLEEAMDYAAQINSEARSTEDCVKGIGAFLTGESLSW